MEMSNGRKQMMPMVMRKMMMKMDTKGLQRKE